MPLLPFLLQPPSGDALVSGVVAPASGWPVLDHAALAAVAADVATSCHLNEDQTAYGAGFAHGGERTGPWPGR